MKKRALISVFDKDGVLELAKFLRDRDVEIISSGGTYKYLKKNNIEVKEISEITDFPEMLDGRVKTLHPLVHAGILAIRDNKEHMKTLEEREINTIDYVVVNLYPFFEKVREDLSFEEKVEFIDIGGPTMLRAAAKNFRDVVVLSDKKDYEKVMNEIKENNCVSFKLRKTLAGKVFNLMSAYDAAISNFLLEGEEEYPEYLSVSYKKIQDLRYGENPHQGAAYYSSTEFDGAMNSFEILNGKALSYNNIKAYDADPVSIFGGIVAINRKIDKATAEEMVKIFLEVVAAPDFDEDALEVLRTKKNLRVIKCKNTPQAKNYMVTVDGGILVQGEDNKLANEYKVVTEKEPTEMELRDMIFGMKVVKYVKSNAIVVVKDGVATGIGGGQVNRIWATKEALERGKGGAVLASDAFFPFRDCVDEAAKNGIKAIIQPGGSIRDEESIEACNEHGISMVFTGVRHFKH